MAPADLHPRAVDLASLHRVAVRGNLLAVVDRLLRVKVDLLRVDLRRAVVLDSLPKVVDKVKAGQADLLRVADLDKVAQDSR